MRANILLLAYLGTAYSAMGVVEVDLVFPRNQTYAPAAPFPIVFAFQNSKLAPYISPSIWMSLRSLTNYSDSFDSLEPDLKRVNFSSSEPYYETRMWENIEREDKWQLVWELSWRHCTNASNSSGATGPLVSHGPLVSLNYSHHVLEFTTKFSAQPADLVAATTNRNCSEKEGFAIDIASTQPIPSGAEWHGVGNECAILAPTPTPAPTPCKVTIDSAAAQSILSSISADKCEATRTSGPSCRPDKDKKSNAPRHAGVVAGVLAVVIGVSTFTAM